MPICKQCGKYFPYAKVIDGKKRSLNGRTRCLDCIPWGAIKIRKEKIPNRKICKMCGKELVNTQTVYCSSECKSKRIHKTKYISHPRKLMTKEERQETLINYKKRIYNERDRVFGTKCFICGYHKSLNLHRKSGESHKLNITWILIALKHPEEWVKLCPKCHTGTHFCMSQMNMSWEEIVIKLKK